MAEGDRRKFRSKAARLEAYKEMIILGVELREKEERNWRDNTERYRTELGGRSSLFQTEQVQINHAYSYIETMLPSLVFSDPTISAVPLNRDAELSQKTVEALLAMELKEAQLRESIIAATVDAMLKGTGILNLGFYGTGLIANPGEDSKNSGNTKSSDINLGWYRPGKLYVDDIRPEFFIVDPCCKKRDLSDAGWCAVQYARPLSEIKNDPQYSKKDNLQANMHLLSDQYTSFSQYEAMGGGRLGESSEYVVLTQFWDGIERKIYVFAEGHDAFLAVYDWTLPVKQYPFYVVQLTEDNDKFWVQSPIDPWKPLSKAVNEEVTAQHNHVKRHVRKYLADKSALDEEDYEKLTTPIDGAVIPVNTQSTGGGLANAVQPLQDAPMNADSYAITAQSEERIRTISGVSEFDQGSTRPGERPAAEIQRLAQGANIRRQSMAFRVSRPLKMLAQDAFAITRVFYTSETVVRIIGKKGETIWAPVEAPSLPGAYSFDVSIEEAEPTTRRAKINAELEKVQVFTPLAQLFGIDMKPMIKTLGEAFGVQVRFLPMPGTAPADPGLEWFEIREGDNLRPHPTDNHAWHIETHMQQLQDATNYKGEEAKKPSLEAIKALLNHLEEHKALLTAQQQSIQGLQTVAQQQQPGGAAQPGSPGPAPGAPSPNPGGGIGVGTGAAVPGNLDQLQGGF